MTTAIMPMPSHTRLRMTARGRRLVVGMVSLSLAAAVFVGVLAGGEALASRSASAPAGEFTTVLVEPGDSLWSIALDVAPGGLLGLRVAHHHEGPGVAHGGSVPRNPEGTPARCPGHHTLGLSPCPADPS